MEDRGLLLKGEITMMKAIKNFMNKQWTWGDLLQTVRRCIRTVCCSHRCICGMGKVAGTQGTERNSESKSGRVRDLIKIRPLPFYF